MQELIFERPKYKSACACGRRIHRTQTACWICRRDKRIANPEAIVTAAEKRCAGECGLVKAISEYHLEPNNKDGHRNTCKPCRKSLQQQERELHPELNKRRCARYYEGHKEEAKQYGQRWRSGNRSKYRAQKKKWKTANPDKVLGQIKRRSAVVREETLKAFGGCCECCGESDFRFLTFDHRARDGAEHRRSLGGRQNTSAHSTVSWIRRNMEEAKRIFRILCWNCNNGSWKNGGTCPHQEEFNIVAMAQSLEVRQLAA